MSKYYIQKLWGLRELLKTNDDLYAPSGNRFTAVSNGFLSGQLLYDHSTKKLYGLCLKEIKDADAEYLQQCEGQWAQEEARKYINYADAMKIVENKGLQEVKS